jgi:hypothetical protein
VPSFVCVLAFGLFPDWEFFDEQVEAIPMNAQNDKAVPKVAPIIFQVLQ